MSFQRLSNDFIPYACLFNKSTCLTKKGELFQVLEINIHDLKDNSENGMRQSFRDHIAGNLPDYENYAFWIYTIKQKSPDLIKNNQQKEDSFFLNYLNEDMWKIKKSINSFSIKIFICIFYKSINQKIGFLDLIATFSDKITIKKELQSLENASISLSKTVNNIVNTLSKYAPKILSSYISNNIEYSELINFLGFFVNLNYKEYKTEPIDISEQINNSEYSFDGQDIIIKNEKTKICNIFSIKDRPSISVKSSSNILSIPGEMLICEHFTYCKKDEIKKALLIKEFSSTNNATKGKKLLKAATYIGLISEDNQNMKLMLNFMSQRLSSYGVLAVMEDISKDKIFHAIKPGNFKFIDRLCYDTEDNIATFLYGYVSAAKTYQDILFDKPILTLPSLKQNPIDIKIDINNKNIIISGQEKSGKTTICNIINAALYQELRTKLFILELSDKSSAFVKAMNGENYLSSVDKFKNTTFFNISRIINLMESSFAIEYLRDILLLMTSYGNLKINDQVIHEINTISIAIYENIIKQNNPCYFHHFKEYFKDSIIESEIAKWHSIGKYSHFFDNIEDFLIDAEKDIIRIQFDHTIYQNDIMSTIIIYNILVNIIYNPDNKNSIIVINNPFYLMRNHFFNNKIKGLMKIASDRKIIIIFKNNQLNLNHNSSNDFSSIIESSGLAIHFGGNLINQEYAKFFRLEKYEQNALNTLSKIKFSFIVKERDDTFSVNCNLSKFNKTLAILSGGDAIATELNKIKDIIGNNDIRSVLRIYYENQKIDISMENNPFEQSIISSEIEKILS